MLGTDSIQNEFCEMIASGSVLWTNRNHTQIIKKASLKLSV